jgi:hypothetical protein
MKRKRTILFWENPTRKSFNIVILYATTLGLTGTLGVPLYTEIVVSGGDSGGRRLRKAIGPDIDVDVLSYGVSGSIVAQLEGCAPCSNRGDRVRP